MLLGDFSGRSAMKTAAGQASVRSRKFACGKIKLAERGGFRSDWKFRQFSLLWFAIEGVEHTLHTPNVVDNVKFCLQLKMPPTNLIAFFVNCLHEQ